MKRVYIRVINNEPWAWFVSSWAWERTAIKSKQSRAVRGKNAHVYVTWAEDIEELTHNEAMEIAIAHMTGKGVKRVELDK